MKRFTGALVALGVLVVLGAIWGVYYVMNQDPPEVDATPQVFTFEKDDLRGIKVERPSGTIEFVRDDSGEWSWVGRSWRPSDSMVRRVGHQTHDLVARATVAEAEDLDEYGFGDDAMTITLTLAGDKELRFQAGDPNPTSVSWYIRPLPGDTVYVVKKSAVDYWRMDEEQFRETRFAAIEADEAVAIDAVVDGREMVFKRVDTRRWQQTKPVQQGADRQMVRTMLGRTSALKATTFVEDDPEDLAQYGLDEPAHTVRISREGGEPITVHVGDILVGTTPQERYVLRVEDNSVYTARDGFLEAFVEPLEDYRDTRILYLDGELSHYVVHSDRYEPLTVRKTPDGWRWPDDAMISGATPRRLATEAANPRAVAFVDTPEEGVDYGLDDTETWIEVHPQEGTPVEVRVGSALALEEGQRLPNRYLRVSGDETIYVVGPSLYDEIDTLLNEYRRKLETDAEKGLLEDTDAPTAP